MSSAVTGSPQNTDARGCVKQTNFTKAFDLCGADKFNYANAAICAGYVNVLVFMGSEKNASTRSDLNVASCAGGGDVGGWIG